MLFSAVAVSNSPAESIYLELPSMTMHTTFPFTLYASPSELHLNCAPFVSYPGFPTFLLLFVLLSEHVTGNVCSTIVFGFSPMDIFHLLIC